MSIALLSKNMKTHFSRVKKKMAKHAAHAFCDIAICKELCKLFRKVFQHWIAIFFLKNVVVVANLWKKYAFHGQFRFVKEEMIFKVGLKSI